ncbi:tRNA pseudouridine(13) synthase TruD [Umboniibacter marinipuniceus]|uniref:tRNA pseudouridine synthase D n=1 Tax=Umboniibacter marinipuniceus TaxID=569599 RepID=A0A3M0A231_9GAMM|nr:tRNA pseudouridine(13) synthase TruD [Umboniibacter marinipuniceus]RMA78696.1 tRNA pseudouridine13 synthase [Umboniibacter marinipuniceus]
MEFAYNWTFAYGAPQQSATFKSSPEDFIVTESRSEVLTGEGEHLYLLLRKTSQNTAWVAEQIAFWAGVSARDVGYAGRKDRHAVTTQWFSVYLPGASDPTKPLLIPGVELLQTRRHKAKLKRGQLDGNHFKITLRDIDDPQLLIPRLEKIASDGVPNYFGDQRFGRDFNNVPHAVSLASRRKLTARGNDIYLSAARSYLFNQVVSSQVARQEWRSETSPLWGRGRPSDADKVILEPWIQLCDALEFTGLKQERRSSALIPLDFSWTIEQQNLIIEFSLPAGTYATSVLRELVKIS